MQYYQKHPSTSNTFMALRIWAKPHRLIFCLPLALSWAGENDTGAFKNTSSFCNQNQGLVFRFCREFIRLSGIF